MSFPVNAPPQPAGLLAKLRDVLPPGATVFCVQRHTSRSGASRSVSLFAQVAGGLEELDALVAPALGLQLDRKHGGIRAYATQDGVYVDAGVVLVSKLAAALGYPLRHRQM